MLDSHGRRTLADRVDLKRAAIDLDEFRRGQLETMVTCPLSDHRVQLPGRGDFEVRRRQAPQINHLAQHSEMLALVQQHLPRWSDRQRLRRRLKRSINLIRVDDGRDTCRTIDPVLPPRT